MMSGNVKKSNNFSGVIRKFGIGQPKKRKGLSIIEMGLVALAMMIFAAVGVGLYQGFNENNKRAVAHQETRMLADACALYTNYNRAGTPPADLGALVTGLTAANSNDGVAHIPFVTKTGWTATATTFIDPWGNAYAYSAAARTVGSSNNGGTLWSDSF